MTDKKFGLPSNEEWILPNEEIEIDVRYSDDKVVVQFKGFENEADAEDYANTLAEVLPVLLYGSTRVQ
jgi:hypothetical protein